MWKCLTQCLGHLCAQINILWPTFSRDLLLTVDGLSVWQQWVSVFCFFSPPGRCHQHSVWLWCQAKTSQWNPILSLSTKGVGGAFEFAWWRCALLFPVKEVDQQIVIYTKGCVPQFEKWLQDNLTIVAGIFIGIALLQVRWLSWEMVPWESPHQDRRFA